MLVLLSWRNIWRNARRSLIVLSSIVVGIIAVMLANSFSLGLAHQMLENQISLHTAHLQILHQRYVENPQLEYAFPQPEHLLAALDTLPQVAAAGIRLEQFGLLNSALNASGITFVGVQPEREQQLTTIARSIVRGTYLSGAPYEIVLSQETARKLEVLPGDKVVLMAADRWGEIRSEVATVVGIFRTFNSEFDQLYCFVSLPFLQQMLRADSLATAIAIRIRSVEHVEAVKRQIASHLPPPLTVHTYRQLLPLLAYMIEMYAELMWIFYLIVGAAMIFGIVNTILMAVMERITEFGVFLAIGITPGRLFQMILLEALWIGILGAVIGTLAGTAVVQWLHTTGLNLAFFSEGLRALGVAAVVYPVLVPQQILNALVFVPLITVIGALYPAWKVYRLQPVEALRFV